MERIPGFYWIKRHNEWIVAEYKEEKAYKSYPFSWFFAGTCKTIWLPSIQEIDETPITRNADCPTVGRY